ncbi:MAG: aryl-sulfate sulfotransferase, partial [Anaerococcus sp.]|nr:aryl-sulfate sulfotransferase [Anaerococcus sp.]
MKLQYQFKDHLVVEQAKAEKAMLEEFKNGDYTIENPLIKYNLYKLNALSAVICFRTEEEVAINVRVLGKTKEADFYQSFPKAKEHILPIVGLYSDYENKVEVYPWQRESDKVTLTIKTPKTDGAGLVEKMETSPAYLQDQIMFLCPATAKLAIGVDYAGDVRLDFTKPLLWDLKVLDNGNFSMGSDRIVKMPYSISGLYEFNAAGKIYKEYRVPHGYHHDQCFLPNGDIIALNNYIENGTVEDEAVIIDKDTGEIKRRIYFDNFLKPGVQKSGSWSDEDWFHCNSVWYDKNTNSLTFSGRHVNAMVNIDFDTEELNWIISDPENWPEEYHKYLFTPVDNGKDFEWQYEQHSALITPLGDVMCFDNHHYGSQNPDKYLAPNDSYSRGVKYKINTDKMEIEQDWQYGKEEGIDFYSPYICNVVWYNEGHYLVHSGGITYDRDGNASKKLGPYAQVDDPKAVLKARTVEIADGEEKLYLEVNSNYYRAEKIHLYNKRGKDLVLGEGEVLGNLGVTPQMDYDIPANEVDDEFEDWQKPLIIDEDDMLTFKCKFTKGDLVQLILEGENDTRKYFVSTSHGIRGAMCAGTFLPDDDRE